MKKLCVGVLCLLMTAGLLGCGVRPAEDLPETAFEEEVFTQAVTKIDLSAPESQKYRNWLEEYYANPSLSLWQEREFIEPSSTSQKMNKPDIKDSRNEWRSMVEESYAQEGQIWEGWKTWDWNDTWELESYRYIQGWVFWEVLRMRNKVTDEIQMIDEIITDTAADDYGTDFEVTHIDKAYVVYSVGDWEQWSYYFYAFGQDERQFIGREGSAGFLDEERTKWWHRDYSYKGDGPSGLDYLELEGEERANEWHRMLDSVLHYVDLKKLAASDADARQEVARGADQCINAWMAERGGRSVMCFYVMTGYPYSKERDWGDPYYIGIYDPLEGQMLEHLEAPPMNCRTIVTILPSKFYTFSKVCTFSEEGARKPVFESIDFYIINLDI